MMDASRLAEELQAEQEHSQNLERQKKSYELQIKVIQKSTGSWRKKNRFQLYSKNTSGNAKPTRRI